MATPQKFLKSFWTFVHRLYFSKLKTNAHLGRFNVLQNQLYSENNWPQEGLDFYLTKQPNNGFNRLEDKQTLSSKKQKVINPRLLHSDCRTLQEERRIQVAHL